MIKQLLRLLKPWKMIVFDTQQEANTEMNKLYNDGYECYKVYTSDKWVVRYK